MVSRLGRILAILAAIFCLSIKLVFWFSPSGYQNMWPLPALYFIELIALSVISTFLFIRGDPRGSSITWGAAGVLRIFSILGAFSVGFFYLPVALMFVVLSILWDARNKQPVLNHLGIFLMAGIVQSALMFMAI